MSQRYAARTAIGSADRNDRQETRQLNSISIPDETGFTKATLDRRGVTHR